jgi:molybdopterin biosynthesis enzyme MoaB
MSSPILQLVSLSPLPPHAPCVCRYGEQMRSISLKYVPTAVLSRQTAGIRGCALVINLPGEVGEGREGQEQKVRKVWMSAITRMRQRETLWHPK